MNKRKITIQDVARVSQTSTSTVSRVLTGNVPVAEDKRQAVLRAIADLQYRPNLLARGLKTRDTHSIGLLINDILNPFYSALAKGVEDRARVDGYSVVFCNTNEDPARELEDLQMMHDKLVDGIVLAPTGGNGPLIQQLLDAGVALVQVDRRMPKLAASALLLDNEGGAYQATRHLLAGGHTRIALVTYALGQMTMAERERGYRRALTEAGVGSRPLDVVRVPFEPEKEVPQLLKLLRGAQAPTAIVAANNRIALGTLRALRQARLSVPGDVALVVFDDLELYALMTPSLTAVAQPAHEMGRKAAELLLEQLATDEPVPTQTIVFPPKLIVRESSRGPGNDGAAGR